MYDEESYMEEHISFIPITANNQFSRKKWKPEGLENETAIPVELNTPQKQSELMH